MKIKTFLILIVIAAVLSAGGYMLIRSQAGSSDGSMMGRPLFDEFPADRIAMIEIKGPEESVQLKKSENRWVVQTRLNYPADFQKLSNLVKKVDEARIGRVFESNEGSLKRLALLDPETGDDQGGEKGIRINFRDESGREMRSILLGKSREMGNASGPSEGRYLMIPGDSKIYLVDRDFSFLEPVSLEWLETGLTDVPAADIQAILCRNAADQEKILFHFERPEKGKDFEAVAFPQGKKVDRSALDQLSGALASLYMENISEQGPDESPVTMSNILEYRLFNGLIYRVLTGDDCSEDDSCYLKLQVAYQPPPALYGEESNTKEEPGKQTGQKAEDRTDLAKEAVNLNKQFEPWIYIIPGWKKEAFITDIPSLVEELADKEKTS